MDRHEDARAAAYESLHRLVLAGNAAYPPAGHQAAAAAGANPSSSAEPVQLSPQVGAVCVCVCVGREALVVCAT